MLASGVVLAVLVGTAGLGVAASDPAGAAQPPIGTGVRADGGEGSATAPGAATLAVGAAKAPVAPSPASGLQPNGRQLTPAGTLVALGNLPMGGAVTADGRYLWTVSAGVSSNDVRIVDTTTRKVCQVLPLPGASGGIALDSAHRRAYVSGLLNSRWQPSKDGLPGAKGDVVHVFSWTDDLRAGP